MFLEINAPPQKSLNSKQGEDTFYMWSIRSNSFLPVKRNCYAKSNRAFNLQCVNTWVNVWYSLLYFSPLYLPLFICKTCPVVLQLQHSLPSWCIYSSVQLDSDIYVHLLHTIVRHLEGLVPFSPLTFSFFLSLPTKIWMQICVPRWVSPYWTVVFRGANRKIPQWWEDSVFLLSFDHTQ